MAFFWVGVLVALVAVIGYAAYADLAARRDGQVLVPIKEGRGRRTTFVRMSRDDRDQQRAALIFAQQQMDRARRQRDQADGLGGAPEGSRLGALRRLLTTRFGSR